MVGLGENYRNYLLSVCQKIYAVLMIWTCPY